MTTQSKSINKLSEVHNAQVKKGLETYGKPLHPFNGRSAYQDAMEEIVDIAAYVTQLEQERTILKLALESLYGASVLFLDAPDGRAAYPRMRFAEEVRSIREDLGQVGFVMDDDAEEQCYWNSIVAFHAHIEEILNEQEGDAVFVHMPEVSVEIMDGDEDIDDTPEVIPICLKCKGELEWDSGDPDVGWPGQWYCAVCDREGVVEDEV